MSDQIEVQEKIRWEDLEVGEQQETIDWEEENEPVPTIQERFAELSAHARKREIKGSWDIDDSHECIECGVDPAKPGSEFTAIVVGDLPEGAKALASGASLAQGVILAFGISLEQFAKAMEEQTRFALEQEMDYLNTPVLGAVDWREANKRLPNISEMVARINAFCTPSRVNLTGEWGIPHND